MNTSDKVTGPINLGNPKETGRYLKYKGAWMEAEVRLERGNKEDIWWYLSSFYAQSLAEDENRA